MPLLRLLNWLYWKHEVAKGVAFRERRARDGGPPRTRCCYAEIDKTGDPWRCQKCRKIVYDWEEPLLR
jgi:hypothetical protein